MPLLVEDLGVIEPAFERLRDALGLPGMIVLQFGFDPHDPNGPHRAQNHRENCFIYTGTHDQDTIRGWYESLAGDARALVGAHRSGHELPGQGGDGSAPGRPGPRQPRADE